MVPSSSNELGLALSHPLTCQIMSIQLDYTNACVSNQTVPRQIKHRQYLAAIILVPGSLRTTYHHVRKRLRPGLLGRRHWHLFLHYHGHPGTVMTTQNHGLCLADAAQTEKPNTKAVKDMALDQDGFVHVAEDGIARSYACKSSLLPHEFCTTND